MDRQNREKILIHVINILNLSIKKQLNSDLFFLKKWFNDNDLRGNS